jgi:hypothetical protein
VQPQGQYRLAPNPKSHPLVTCQGWEAAQLAVDY